MSTLSGMSSTTSTSGGSRISAVLWQEFADLGEELARAERLGDVAVAAGFAGLRLIAGQRVGGNGDDRHLGQGGYGADAAGRLVTVDRRQLDIHQNEVGLFALGGGDALQAVHRLDHLVAGARQQVADDLPIVLGVLDHQNALAHAAPISSPASSSATSSTRIGRLTRKVAPCPGSDSTEIAPPCISTMRLEIARPSPVPPFLRVLELSTCWNSSKILAWSAAAMPGPVPRTVKTTEPLSAQAPIATSPTSVNLTALPTR